MGVAHNSLMLDTGPCPTDANPNRKCKGNGHVLFSSSGDPEAIHSKNFTVPAGKWAVITGVGMHVKECFCLERYIAPTPCCKEPGGYTNFVIGCGCQPKLTCHMGNPITVMMPGTYRLKYTGGVYRGTSTITYELIDANTVPHQYFTGCCGVH